MIDRGELQNNHEELTQRLQSELEFRPDETGEWLVSDDFTTTDGANGYEWLPTRTRVASTGERLELGVRKVDIEKSMDLSRINGETPKDLNCVRHFWPEDSRIGIAEDEEWFYIGAAIDSTVEGLEKDYQGIHFGLELALAAGATGKSYEELKADGRHEIMFRDAETARPEGARNCLFPRPEEKHEGSEDDDSSWARDAENLRAYPLDTYEKSVHNAPYEVRFGEKTYSGMDGWLIARNYGNRENVSVSMTWHNWDENAEDNGWNTITATLPIPEGVDVQAVNDMPKLTSVELTVAQGDKDKQTLEMQVKVVVEDHGLRIDSEDGAFSVELKEPACTECERPIWKFRWPTEEEDEFRSDPRQKLIITDSGTHSGNGVYYHTMDKDKGSGGHRDTFCVDCFPVVEERYAEEHPLARRSNAVAAVRAKLDELGYSDVQLMPDQVWPVMRERYDHKDGVEMFAFIEYERDGRTITRRAGRPIMLFDGTIIPDMPTREYVEFR